MAIAAGLHMDARRMFHGLALDWEAEKFMQFVADVKAADDGALQIMYGIDRELPESTRDDLSGYASARPVRMGNAAFNQRQNDIFGAVLDANSAPHSLEEALAAPALVNRRVAGDVRGPRAD